jgi:hypothetical protein
MALGFFTDDNSGDSFESIQRKRRLADALLAQSQDGAPIQSWTQGGAKLIQALSGSIQNNRLDAKERETSKAFSETLMRALGGQGGSMPAASPSAMPAGGAAPAPSGAPSDMSPFRTAIASIESRGSGDYNAVGPTNPRLGRALGRYQVMEANIGPWSREALGREVTPDEFMKNPQIQDAIFDHKFKQYIEQFGSPDKAAQAWFGGPGGVGQMNRRDALGTTISAYTDKFNAALPQAGGAQVANLGGVPASAAPQQPAQGQRLAQAVTSPPIPAPQPTGNVQQAMMAILADPRFSQQQKAQAMQMYGLTQAKADFDFQVAGDQLFRINKRTGQAEPVSGVNASRPSDVQKQFEQARREGFQGNLLDYQKALAEARRPQTNVNVNNSADNKFDDTIGTETAKLFIETAKEGPTARADVGRVRQLRSLVETLPGGFVGGAEALASRYGIKIGPNASKIEAAEAIINQLVPAQRPPGSGTMSDRDVDLFKSSLPSLSNTPQGNKIILDTMEAMAQYKAAQAEIATAVVTKQIDRAEGLKRLQSLPDPFATFKSFAGSQPLAPAQSQRPSAPTSFSDDEIQAEMKRRGLL